MIFARLIYQLCVSVETFYYFKNHRTLPYTNTKLPLEATKTIISSNTTTEFLDGKGSNLSKIPDEILSVSSHINF